MGADPTNKSTQQTANVFREWSMRPYGKQSAGAWDCSYGSVQATLVALSPQRERKRGRGGGGGLERGVKGMAWWRVLGGVGVDAWILCWPWDTTPCVKALRSSYTGLYPQSWRVWWGQGPGQRASPHSVWMVTLASRGKLKPFTLHPQSYSLDHIP